MRVCKNCIKNLPPPRTVVPHSRKSENGLQVANFKQRFHLLNYKLLNLAYMHATGAERSGNFPKHVNWVWRRKKFFFTYSRKSREILFFFLATSSFYILLYYQSHHLNLLSLQYCKHHVKSGFLPLRIEEKRRNLSAVQSNSKEIKFVEGGEVYQKKSICVAVTSYHH